MTFYSPRVRTYRALMTDRLGTDLGTRLRKWPSSRSESLSKLSIWRLKNFNLPAAIVKEKEPIPFPKMLDDVVLYLRRFIIDPKNCSCVRPSRHITCFQTFNILKIARYLFSEYTGRHNLLSRLSRCFSREKNKTKQNKNRLLFIGFPFCTRRLGESVNIFNHPCTTNDRLWSMKEIWTLIRESLQVKYYYIFILSSQLYLQYGVKIFLEKELRLSPRPKIRQIMPPVQCTCICLKEVDSELGKCWRH